MIRTIRGPTGPELTDGMQRILTYLEERKGTWNTIRAIAKACGYKTSGTCVDARKAIEALNEHHGVPIVSGNKGFMLAINHYQVMKYAKTLHERATAINNRAKRNVALAKEMKGEEQ